MDVFERIELRRFVGRELLLWLWFETEVFEATLTTKLHGSFGMWLEGRLVLSAGKETTTIKGTMPGQHREAKESLLRGKMPELAALHLAWADHDATFTLKAESMAIAGLKLPKREAESQAAATGEGTIAPPRRPRRKPATASEVAGDEAHEELYERMRVTREIEGIVESLYRDFLVLRLGPAWDGFVSKAIESWASGEAASADDYGAARTKALAGAPRGDRSSSRR